jgi:LysM repeat protein
MTVTGEPARLGDDHHPDAPAGPSSRPVADPVTDVCPYLLAGDGSWQSAHAIREHRCGALEPAVPLTLAKQRQLCLVGAHRTCATYLAAQERASTTGIARARARDGEPTLWPATRSTLLVLEPERRLFGLSRSRTRVGGQAALIAVMGVAFLLLVLARTSPSTPLAGAGASASALAAVSPTPRATPTPGPSPTASVGPSATPGPTPKPTTGPNRKRYKVKSGDTLSAIAVTFGTTLKVLKRINHITDPTVIRPGQVILVPAR